jgi:hypothetical protein
MFDVVWLSVICHNPGGFLWIVNKDDLLSCVGNDDLSLNSIVVDLATQSELIHRRSFF